MTCRELTSFIGDYLANELDAETHQAFERHLSRCPNCVQYVTDYKRAIAVGRQVYESPAETVSDVPEELVAAILAARRAPTSE